MSIRVAINGFGRIGRNVLRAAKQQGGDELDFVAVNDLTDEATLAHLLRYDSVHGRYPGTVVASEGRLTVDGDDILVLSERDPARLPWRELEIDVVVESTGIFRDRDRAARHLDAGARKVIVSAPGKGEDITIVLGVNGDRYRPDRHSVISNASCTTNCLAPVVKVIRERFGFRRGLMTTVHSYTNDQAILDRPHGDPRRARGAAVSMIPTTTGAARATSLVIPEVEGKLDGMAIRVPTPDVSLVDLVAEVGEETSVEEVNQAMIEAASGDLEGILACSDEPLVSVDYIGHPASSIVDLRSTAVMEGRMVKVISWYDNEWGYSSRLVDLVRYVGERLDEKSLEALPPDRLRGRRVLLRADFNLPRDGDGAIAEDSRLRRTLPTIEFLLERGARVAMLSHFGRPPGLPDETLSLRPVAARLSALLGRDVTFLPETVGAGAGEAIEALGEGEALLFENVRFLPGETRNDPALAGEWASMTDLFVNDAFGAAHRAHASTAGVAEAMRARGGEAVRGLLMDQELHYLRDVLSSPERPFLGVLGGAKISGKAEVLRALLPRVDRLLLGGAMANTFLRALGFEMGASLVEEECLELAREILEEGSERIVLPVDCIVAGEIEAGASTRCVDRADVGRDDRVGDIGELTRELFGGHIGPARSIFWNGPMGVFERPPFGRGTERVARELARATDHGALTVLGGGDSAAAAANAGVAGRLSYISTGGGAALELVAGHDLPGITALSEEVG